MTGRPRHRMTGHCSTRRWFPDPLAPVASATDRRRDQAIGSVRHGVGSQATREVSFDHDPGRHFAVCMDATSAMIVLDDVNVAVEWAANAASSRGDTVRSRNRG